MSEWEEESGHEMSRQRADQGSGHNDGDLARVREGSEVVLLALTGFGLFRERRFCAWDLKSYTALPVWAPRPQGLSVLWPP